VDLNCLITQEKQCPETAYMLMYISNEHENELLKPITLEMVPSWIQDREAVMQKNLDYKNNFQEVYN
jgi:hypothetical protein